MSARSDQTQSQCKAACGLDASRPTLMVTGGSLGAGSLNSFVLAFVEANGSLLRDGQWQILHQTGAASKDASEADRWTDRLESAYRAAGIRAVVTEYCQTMGQWWSAADLAISRAGAGAVAEAWASNTPSLFMPYPYHKDQHQRANAAVLVNTGGAVCLDDQIAPQANLSSIAPQLIKLMSDSVLRQSMRDRLAALGPVDGAASIARSVTEFDRDSKR